MLFQPVALDEREREVIERIATLKKDLSYLVGNQPRNWQGVLRRTAFARAIQGSNSIEGYNVTVEDAIAAAEDEEPFDASAETWAAVTGYRDALTYVLRLADDPHFRFSVDLLRSLHYMMLQYDPSKNPGRWRPGPVYVWDARGSEVVYEGAAADAVPELMDELVSELQNADGDVPPLVKAAMGHLNLVMIHPFSDGNGRMARCLQTLVLARTGTLAPPFSSIEEYLGRNTLDYYAVLSTVGRGRWSPSKDTRPWIRFCLTAHFRQATTLLRRTREIEKLWTLLEAEVAKRRLPERTIFALIDAAMGFRVRNATYRKPAEVSNQTASRDLRAAVDAGLLEPHGKKRGTFYVASPSIREVRERTQESKRVEDPFEAGDTATLRIPGL